MRKYLIILLLAISVFLIFVSRSLAQKKDMIWLNADLPPYVILNNPYKGQGSIDYMQKLVKDSLIEYKHISMVANSKRVFHELKRRDMIAYASALKTKEREYNVIFSIPYILGFPNAILIQKTKLKYFKTYINNGVFLLDKAIKEKDYKLGISVGRVYGGVIDKILSKYKGNKNIKVYYDNISRKHINELLVGNIDYVIGYPSEMTYFLKKLKKKESVIAIPIKGMPPHLLGYFAFSKTKWGEKIVMKTNIILKKHRNTKVFHDSNEYWLDERSKKLYRKYIKEFYKNK
ncbi:MAG: TIGR02285 family protein [Deltaproteobacteria bacterium]|nr:TIGR02285 family protein [Deltaproteobacteria bacterium]